MTTTTLSRAAATSTAPVRIADDRAMLKAAAELTRDLNAPRPAVYWADFLSSVAIGYAGLAVAIAATPLWLTIVAGVVAMFALYRGMSFIHELTHVKHASLPHFRLGYNIFIGVPMLVPSFMYEGVHNLHHARTRYGTSDDPEYLPLALMKPWSLPVFVLVAALAPFALIFRYGVLSPLSLLSPSLRRIVVERFSALAINPQFRRRLPEGDFRRQWIAIETACAVWAMSLIALVATGTLPLRAFAIMMAVASGVAVINQLRTLVAHLWENEGEVMTVTAQYLDSVNVPPPATLPALWAPVGLRYHALHHLLPGVPYHALGEAHRRLSAVLDRESPYYKANYVGMPGLIAKIARSTMLPR
ncbi:fatty acid desaturase [Sphingomonas sp.]|uniref:fatty acid desaturase family protein n=1 Tax=Sphingomonas sp. TaxID=28214 RepID=UPI002624B148|nr:fatty acid desaturase [Sphingomonas sp.]MDF2603171.1 fatty acid desaturase [Sphingomonas sp.]